MHSPSLHARPARGQLRRRFTAIAGATALTVTGLVAVASPASAACAMPTITAVTPDTGPTSGGTQVTITGTNFQCTNDNDPNLDVYKVTFGGIASSFTVDSDTTITATAPAQSAGTVDIVASSNYAPYGDSPLSPADQYTYTAAASADLGVTVSDSADPAALGDTYTYTATVTNNGPTTATGTTLSTTLSGAARTIVSATPSQGSCTITAPTVNCSLGALANTATATVTITVEPAATGTITATATATAATDPNSANNTAAQSTTVNNSLGCTIIGTAGNDTPNGTNGADVICGLGGDDTINGGNGNDVIYGGSGDDTIDGGNGEDVIYGNDGNNGLSGGNGNDTINAGAGNDVIYGGNGNDTINAGAGTDTVYGGNGNDTCTNTENPNSCTP